MKSLIRKTHPEIGGAEIIEIFEIELDGDSCVRVPVEIEGFLYRFTKNKYGFWEPIFKPTPLITVAVRWYVSELIELMLYSSDKLF